MSIESRMQELEAEEAKIREEEERQERLNVQEASRIWQEKHDSELLDIKREQNKLLEKLKRVGVVRLLEEYTEDKIFPHNIEKTKAPGDPKYGLHPTIKLPLNWLSAEDFRKAFDREWRLHLKPPTLSKDLIWDTALTIYAVKRERRGGCFDEGGESVALKYDPSNKITITGEYPTISEQVLSKNKEAALKMV